MNEKEIKVIDAARSVFLKYGYKRVTMHDIATAAHISRPALYLVFPSKEEVFKAVVKQQSMQNLAEIRKGLDRFSSPEKQLWYAFEIWTIRPFEVIMESEDAKELIDCTRSFSKDVFENLGALFEAQLVSILEPLIKSNKKNKAAQIASILRYAVRGFKESAKNVDELRQMIKNFLELILTALKVGHKNDTK